MEKDGNGERGKRRTGNKRKVKWERGEQGKRGTVKKRQE